MSITGVGTTSSYVNPYAVGTASTESALEVQTLLGGGPSTAAAQLSGDTSMQALEESMLLGGGASTPPAPDVSTDYVYQALMMKAGMPAASFTTSPTQAAVSYDAANAQAGADSAVIDTMA